MTTYIATPATHLNGSAPTVFATFTLVGMAYTVTHLSEDKRVHYNGFNSLVQAHNAAKELSETTDGVQVRSSWPDSLGLVAEYKAGCLVGMREATERDNENGFGYERCGGKRK